MRVNTVYPNQTQSAIAPSASTSAMIWRVRRPAKSE
jgi:hypothetical protein